MNSPRMCVSSALEYASWSVCLAIAGLLLGSGCQRASDQANAKSLDARFLLVAEPEDAITPTEAKEAHRDVGPITLVGRIHAGDYEPFERGQASFMLSELPDAGHADGDPEHADNCPFCKRKLENAPKVVVKIMSPDGSVMPVDARELLGVKAGDIVVVRGTGKYQADVDLVEIAAEGVFRR